MSPEAGQGPVPGLVLLTGATGYLGGRLLHALRSRGAELRCLARSPERLRRKTDAEVVKGDLLDTVGLVEALANVHTAYYLVHSMASARDFEAADRTAARNFADAARDAGVRRIVYMGGLARGAQLSPHFSSRHEVGQILASAGVETVELRASVVLGAGSASFEMIRSLVERLPVMVTPSWVHRKAQPIAADDAVASLVAAAELPPGAGGVYEIGGDETLSYADLMRRYAQVRGLRRLMIPVPVLTPYLSSLWLGLVTPLYSAVGRRLIESIRTDSVMSPEGRRLPLGRRLRNVREALELALEEEDRETVGPGDAVPQTWCVDARSRRCLAVADHAFACAADLGGGRYVADWLWRLRGAMDRLVGGVGMRRGRPRGRDLRPGDQVDFWRVEAAGPRRLMLRSEMRLPGRAWLIFEVVPEKEGCVVKQTALFDPRGLLGRIYWYLLYPAHAWIFQHMLDRAVRRAEEAEESH